MMTEEKRIEWLLELQEHPEQLTDEQFLDKPSGKAERQQILADEEMRQLVQQLGFAKRAFKHDELKNDTPDVDDEWEKFAACHAEELDALDERERLRERLRVGDGTSGIHKPRFVLRLAPRKIAASFIGVLLASGIAFAAIWSLTPNPSPKERGVDTTFVGDSIEESNHSPLLGRGAGGEASHVFNNVPLDSMLTAIATAHGVGVEFENETARQLRFHFVWKREDSLTRVVEKLNTFEAVNIGMEDNKLVVR